MDLDAQIKFTSRWSLVMLTLGVEGLLSVCGQVLSEKVDGLAYFFELGL